jgi:hypothetical protein
MIKKYNPPGGAIAIKFSKYAGNLMGTNMTKCNIKSI